MVSNNKNDLLTGKMTPIDWLVWCLCFHNVFISFHPSRNRAGFLRWRWGRSSRGDCVVVAGGGRVAAGVGAPVGDGGLSAGAVSSSGTLRLRCTRFRLYTLPLSCLTT